MEDLFVSGKQIEDAYKKEEQALTDKWKKILIGLLVGAVLVFWLGESLLMKLLDAINGILSVLIVLLIIALPIALIGGGIYFMPGLLSTKKEEMTALKADYKKKLNDAIFYECFERYFSQSDFTLKDENSTLLKHNEKGEVSIDFSDMLFEDIPFSYKLFDNGSHVYMPLESSLTAPFSVHIRNKPAEKTDKDVVPLDSIQFNSIFTTTCADRIVAFKVMTPAVMNKILELNNKFRICIMRIENDAISLEMEIKAAMLENDDETITVQGVISSAQNQIENLAAIANLIKIIQLNKI